MSEAFLVRRGGSGSSKSGPPEFSYTGDFLLIDDGDENWRLKLLTSGNLIFTKLISAKKGIDVFLVGGGAGGGLASQWGYTHGGGGGYTKTSYVSSLKENYVYEIAVGAGGAVGSIGGASSAFGLSVQGGSGADGGSGGGAGNVPGASDGADSAGKGQGTTTREFGEMDGTLYAGGGGSPGGDGGGNGEVNTGGGGHPGGWTTGGGPGGSGIVIIRNHRGVRK